MRRPMTRPVGQPAERLVMRRRMTRPMGWTERLSVGRCLIERQLSGQQMGEHGEASQRWAVQLIVSLVSMDPRVTKSLSH